MIDDLDHDDALEYHIHVLGELIGLKYDLISIENEELTLIIQAFDGKFIDVLKVWNMLTHLEGEKVPIDIVWILEQLVDHLALDVFV